MKQFLEELLGYFESGGFVMPPLAIATVILWYVLGYRWMVLHRGSVRSPRVLIQRYAKSKGREPKGTIDSAVVVGLRALIENSSQKGELRPVLDDAFGQLERPLSAGKAVVKSIVTAAPLAGLLGTVIGMIETFDSLGDMTLFSQSGGIAGGISQALFTTQMGLAVAVPGIVVGRVLDRKQGHLQRELNQIKDILCSEADTLTRGWKVSAEPRTT